MRAKAATQPAKIDSNSTHTAQPTHEFQRLANASARVTGLAQVQAMADAHVSRADQGGALHRVAALGTRGSARALPHRDRIQASFGRHDVSQVAAHTDASARSSSEALGVKAFASGEHVVFAGEPSLFVAAHEAAHVIQQRAGIQLFGGFGQPGDAYERNADEVARKVVAGESAVGLLDRHATATRSAGEAVQPMVQCWGEPDHYSMGQLAGFKAVEQLAKLPPKRARSYALGLDEVAPTKPTFLRGDDTKIEEVAIDEHEKFFVRDHEGNPISFGAANRIGGDLSGRPLGDDKIARAPTLEQWPAKVASGRASALAKLKSKSVSKSKASASVPLVDESVDVPTDYAPLGKFGEYTLLATNANHFFPLARLEYLRQHQSAKQKMWMALQLDAKPDAKSRRRAEHLATQAILIEGFAGHFLADCFAAGHLSPHALGRIGHKGALDTGALVNTWHDLFNALPDGVPTTLGRFHGDYSMDGGDLEYVSSVLSNSLLEIVMPWYAGVHHDGEIALPEPDLPKILADPVVGPLWAAMCGDYAKYLDALSTVERRTSKTGLSKYAIYETTTGQQASKEEVIGPILAATFGGKIGVPERAALAERDLGRIRGKVAKIVGALAQLLDYRGGWQPASGLSKDFEPLDEAPATRKFMLDLKSAALADKSPATAPILPLLADLDHWLGMWGTLAQLDESKDEEQLRETTGELLELSTLVESTKASELEGSRERFWLIARKAKSGFAALDVPVEFDAEPAKVDQGPGASLRRAKAISELYHAHLTEHGSEASLDPLKAKLAALPKPQASTSGAMIGLDVRVTKALHAWRPAAALALAHLRGALEALAADPRPSSDDDLAVIYGLVGEANRALLAQVGDIEGPTAAQATEAWCEELAKALPVWQKLGGKFVKTHETARREVLFGMQALFDNVNSPFDLDLAQLYVASARKLGDADSDVDE